MPIAAPAIITRSEWGAQDFKGQPRAQPGYQWLSLHHAAGHGASDLVRGKMQVKAIQDLHQNDRGWADIGYHFVIDAAGNIYQGRPYLDDAPLSEKPRLAIGAHALGHNTRNIGVCLLGCFHPQSNPSTCDNVLSEGAGNALVDIFSFFCDQYGISPGEIYGHGHWTPTDCPGSNLLIRLSEIRLRVRTALQNQDGDGLPVAASRWHNALQSATTTGASAVTARQDGLAPGVGASHKMANTDLQRVMALKNVFMQSGELHDVPPALLAGIASRESRCGNVLAADGTGDHGFGFGIMQVDKRFHGIVAGGPRSQEHVDQATRILIDFRRSVKRKHPNWSDSNILKGALVAYNSGVRNVQTIARMDIGTTGDDYGSDVAARAQLFLDHF